MRLSSLVGRTLRSAPSGVAPWMGHAARAGFARPVPGGLVLLPLGLEVVGRLERVLLEGVEIAPVAARLEGGRTVEALGSLLIAEVQSYRHLPLRIATSVSGEVPLDGSAGHPVSSELLVVGAFSSPGEAAGFVGWMAGNMGRLAKACGLSLAESGLGGERGEWFAANAEGEVPLLACHTCGWRTRHAMAPFLRSNAPDEGGEELRLVHTPGATTIQSLADMLGVAREQTLKALFLAAPDGEVVFVVVRGDLEVSLEKLGALVGRTGFRAATDAEIQSTGAVPGFASPIGLAVRAPDSQAGIIVAVDDSVYTGTGFIAGANRPDYHFAGVDPRRDLSATYVGDLAQPPQRAACATCGSPLAEESGTLVGAYSPLPAPRFGDEAGAERQGAAVGITIEPFAWLEVIINACADEAGIHWPASVAPADAHVVDLKAAAESRQAVENLQASGLRVLYDDRSLGAGAKFTDADLIGCPLRVTVSPRSLQAGGAELSLRRGLAPEVVPIASLPEAAKRRLHALMFS